VVLKVLKIVLLKLLFLLNYSVKIETYI